MEAARALLERERSRIEIELSESKETLFHCLRFNFMQHVNINISKCFRYERLTRFVKNFPCKAPELGFISASGQNLELNSSPNLRRSCTSLVLAIQSSVLDIAAAIVRFRKILDRNFRHLEFRLRSSVDPLASSPRSRHTTSRIHNFLRARSLYLSPCHRASPGGWHNNLGLFQTHSLPANTNVSSPSLSL